MIYSKQKEWKLYIIYMDKKVVIIPTYNEKENIEKIIRAVFALEGDLALSEDQKNDHEQGRDHKSVGQHHVGVGRCIQTEPGKQKAETPDDIA